MLIKFSKKAYQECNEIPVLVDEYENIINAFKDMKEEEWLGTHMIAFKENGALGVLQALPDKSAYQ